MKAKPIVIMGILGTLFACHGSKNVSGSQVEEPVPPVEQPAKAGLVFLNDQIKKGTIDLVVYEHDDGSLPPQHKRDYSIRIYRDSIRVNIWGHMWSGVDFKRTYPSTPEVLQAFLGDLSELGVCKHPAPQNQALGTGGTSGSLRAYAGEECLFSAGAYFCQGLHGDLQMNVSAEEAIESLFQKRVPEDMEKLFREALPYQN